MTEEKATIKHTHFQQPIVPVEDLATDYFLEI
jgi:hypothetical protein